MIRRMFVATLFLLAAALTMTAQNARPRPVPHWTANQTMWDSGIYAYDGGGNIMSAGGDRYRYDGANRLTSATAHTPSSANAQTFQYDAHGNLRRVDTQTTPTGGTAANVATVLAIDAATNRLIEQPTTADCPSGVVCVSGGYDSAGRQTSANGTIAYQWDALGNMTELRSLGRQERYVYDASNERIAIVAVSGSAERRSYTLRGPDAKVLRELVDRVNNGVHQWTWSRDYVYRSGQLLASVVPAAGGPAIRHYHLDHLGTPRVTTDANGYRLSIHTYWPYGAEAPGSETDDDRMKFTGHERDFGGGPGEDLDYMHARFYAPLNGRFLSVDPVLATDRALTEPRLWNRYAYAGDDPLDEVDPDGQRGILLWERFRHIIHNHINKNVQLHKSKFATDNPKQVQKLIQKTVQPENVVAVQKNGKLVYEKTFSKPVGTMGEKTVRVIAKPAGVNSQRVITSFPTLSTIAGVANAAGVVSAAVNLFGFHKEFEERHGRAPNFGESMRFMVTGDPRSDEAIFREATVPII